MKLVIDLGGTNLRIAQIKEGRIVNMKSVPCPATATETVVIDLIKSLIREQMTVDVDNIGVGVPSVVDAERGIVYDVVNIPSWKEVHLKDILEKEFGVRTCIDNDVNCFVLGEKYFGAGVPYNNVVGITLGTGVGAGIIVDGKLYRGANTGAGEVGSMPYLNSDYEHYCSSSYLVEHYHADGRLLVERAAKGDKEALKAWQELGFHLGKLLQVLLFAYDPEAIIIGGGISSAHTYFEDAMYQSMRENFPYQQTINHIHLFFSQLEGSNMLGASQL